MKKLALVLIGALAFTTVQAASSCSLYVDLAAEEVSSPPYPDYFGAGEEYFNAAECYSNRGNREKARPLYLKAAEFYTEASSYLVEDGDYYQAALSNERAARSYEKIERLEKAIENYEQAVEKYRDNGDYEKAQELEGKVAELQEIENGSSISGSRGASFKSLVGLASLITLFISVLLITLIIIANLSTGQGGSNKRTPIEDSGGGSSSTTEKKISREPIKSKEPRKTSKKKQNPEQRVIEKLREKYKPD